MNKKYVIATVLVGFALFLSVLLFQKDNISVIKYFPIDDSVTFSSYGTELNFLSETDQDEYDIDWNAYSQVEEPIYLRQDVSLLYTDGRLKGILSKWKENEKKIRLKSAIHGEDSSHYQAITFHHGEIHYPDDEIKSIQTMSQDELYVIDSPHSVLDSFERPTRSNHKEWKKTLDHATNQQLSYHWKQLIRYFQIPQDSYVFVPLTELHVYETKTVPTLNQEETNKVIGQLWEGLYKNYILTISNNEKPVNSFVPLILFDKEGKHLLVLFQDQNGEKQKLIQTYSPVDSRS